MRPVTRWLLLAAGSVALALGVLGLFLPLLPATPFLLLSAACYSKSSERFYRWLVDHRVLGTYIRNYVERQGVPMRAKLYTLGVLWTTMLISGAFAVRSLHGRLLLLAIATGVTIHILKLKTLRLRH